MSLGKFIIGIDIGTTITHVSVVKGDLVVSVPTATGKVGFPTLVTFDDGKCLVGEAALKYAMEEERMFKGYKMIPVNIHNDSKQPIPEDVEIKFMGKTRRFKVWEMIATILAQAKKDAERFLGERIKGAVIVVPSHFNSAQRRAMVKATFIANLPIERLLNRTSALMIANSLELDGYYVIIDFGNAWFQVAVMTRYAGEVNVLKDDFVEIGGQSFIIRLMLYYSSLFSKECNFNVMSDKAEVAKLRSACEKAKSDLDFSSEAFVRYQTLERFISFKIKRKKFEELCASEIKKITDFFHNVLHCIGLPIKTFTGVITAGQSSSMHFFTDLIQNTFPRTHKIIANDSTVAHGAAQLHNGRYKRINEISFHTFYISINPDTFQVILPKGAKLPTFKLKKLCIPYNLQNFNISIESDNHQILLCKPMDVSTKCNMRELIFSIKLIVDINGLLHVNFYTVDPIMFLPFEYSTLNQFEIIDVQSNILTILENLQFVQARNDLRDYKMFIFNLRLFINKEDKKGRNCNGLISLHNIAVSWLENNITKSSCEIRGYLNELNQLERKARLQVGK